MLFGGVCKPSGVIGNEPKNEPFNDECPVWLSFCASNNNFSKLCKVGPLFLTRIWSGVSLGEYVEFSFISIQESKMNDQKQLWITSSKDQQKKKKNDHTI